MNKQEYLLTCLSEECAEIQQAVSKALRFGLDNYNPNGLLTNEGAISLELNDLQAIKEMLIKEGVLTEEGDEENKLLKQRKKDKVLHFMNISADCGTLSIK